MKKYLMLAGIFTVLAGNAQSAGWYYEDDGYNQYEARQQYNNQDYYSKQPRYQQLPSSASRRYQERQYTRSQNMNTYQTTETNKIRPYIGLDVGMSKVDFSSDNDMDYDSYMDDSYNSLSLVAGAKFNRYFGIEAFIQQSSESDKDYEYGKTTTQYNAIGVDFIGYAPINQEFEILASLGLAQYNFHVKDEYEDAMYEYWEKDSQNTTGIRIGLGAQYNVTDNVALRAMARYVKLSDDDVIKNMVEMSLGLRYMF